LPNLKILFVSPSLSVQADAPLNSITRAAAIKSAGADVELLAYPEKYPLSGTTMPCPYRSVLGSQSPLVKNLWSFWRSRLGTAWLFIIEPFLVKRASYKIARREKFDIICMHHAEPWILLPMVVFLKFFKRYTPTCVVLPMAFTGKKVPQNLPWRTKTRGALNARCAKRLAEHVHIICENSHYAGALDIAGHRNLHIIPEGYANRINSYSQKDARRKLGIDADKRMVLLFGVASKAKGADLLIRALEEVPPAFLVYIVGQTGGVYESSWGSLNRLQETGWKENLRIVSRFIPEDEMELYFSATDACIFPYRYGFSTISSNLRQAGEMGKAVLASDQYHFTDIVKKYNVGMLFEPENVPALARCLREFSQKPDEWFAEIRRNSERLVQERSWKTVGGEYVSLFKSVLAGCPSEVEHS